MWRLPNTASLELVFRFLRLPSMKFVIFLEHKNVDDVELEEEIQPVLHEAVHSEPGNALTLKNH